MRDLFENQNPFKETRRKSFDPPSHARQHYVALAGAVASLVATGYSMYQNSQKKPGGADVYGSKIQPPTLEKYDPSKGANDYAASLPVFNNIASSMTGNSLALREKVMPGSHRLLGEAGTDLTAMGRGQVPTDVVNQTNRDVAQRTGAAFDPTSPSSFAGGPSTTTAGFSRAIGQTSQDQVNKFLAVAPGWEQLADSFTFKPQDAVQGALSFLKQRYDYAEQQYTADLNTAKINASPNPAAAGSYNDAMLAQALQQMSGTGAGGGYQTDIKNLVAGLQGVQSGYSKNFGGGSSSGSSQGSAWSGGGGMGDQASPAFL